MTEGKTQTAFLLSFLYGDHLAWPLVVGALLGSEERSPAQPSPYLFYGKNTKCFTGFEPESARWQPGVVTQPTAPM
jgi:hypothetical protein